MTLHPIAVVDRAIEEYRNYLFTEFRARDPKLREALEQALAERGFLAQEPFFQAHRPFRDGAAWSDLGLDARLAAVMAERSHSPTAYLHQSEAIAHLLGPAAAPLVVTTGTGSGKTECFLLPVIQNAVADAGRFDSRAGLTALLVYPMNALANDQEARIRDYLKSSGHEHIDVRRYDRQTQQDERERMRRNPPHILLTNYMMLEYLLVRPADREALFANHRCRFVVLDEVHTYRGTLGANIALLVRRLFAHLRHAAHTWGADDRGDARRFPHPVPVGTSATIKSIDESGRTPEEVRRLRDTAVQEFFARLTGVEPTRVKVIGETLRDLDVPPEARWPANPVAVDPPDATDPEAARRTVAALAGLEPDASVETAARHAGILWTLGDMLARKPLSVAGIVERVRESVPERRDADPEAVRKEVEAALVAGAALPDGTPGVLRLRTHRFVRGGWRFHRCLDAQCRRLLPMGEERCNCGSGAAPLYLCRSCGADVLRFEAEPGEPKALRIHTGAEGMEEWILYNRSRHPEVQGSEEIAEMRGRPVLEGSFDPETLSFAVGDNSYPIPAVLAPARNRCLVCGTFTGTGSALTPVALGVSAAVRVVAEGVVEGLAREHSRTGGGDGKERLLIFADSRQDAAHQARFISYAGRYDRMRRRLVRVLAERGQALSIADAVQALMVQGVERHDNPLAEGYDDAQYLPDPIKRKARAWEEAPLLDDLAVSSGYRASVLNLGLVGLRYERLDTYVRDRGGEVATFLGLAPEQIEHVARCLLDEMRRRAAFSRELLRYHPGNPSAPEELLTADWERRASTVQGYACDAGQPVGWRDSATIPDGANCNNAWRRKGAGGGVPSLQRRFTRLVDAFGGKQATEDALVTLLKFLTSDKGPRLLVPVKLHGYRKPVELLQVNADTCTLVLLPPDERRRCTICNARLAWAPAGFPCPACPGTVTAWPDADVQRNRYVERILATDLLPLRAEEHTAQVTGEDRMRIETNFKAGPAVSPVNVLACSPTLELGIDVGGLDAVVMRNVPPRPDNYAQRGGRAGRRTRVGVVLGYARSTPHDGYFYDRPEEMIAGEVPAPGVSLGNRDVLLRHLYAIAFGLAEPGLAGKMGEYVTVQGELVTEPIGRLIEALKARAPQAARLALDAWGEEILGPAGLATAADLDAALRDLPRRVRDLFDGVCLQVRQLEETIKRCTEVARGDRAAVGAMELKRRLLGIRDDRPGIRHLYMLDGPEVEFELEPAWAQLACRTSSG